MWMTIIMVCANVYSHSCVVLTSKDYTDYYTTKEECLSSAIGRAEKAQNDPSIFLALPMCQEIILDNSVEI
tara:strand:- start:436 stop:648 length:213 start_codon:yes stop_codon:yes gene_type:complete